MNKNSNIQRSIEDLEKVNQKILQTRERQGLYIKYKYDALIKQLNHSISELKLYKEIYEENENLYIMNTELNEIYDGVSSMKEYSNKMEQIIVDTKSKIELTDKSIENNFAKIADCKNIFNAINNENIEYSQKVNVLKKYKNNLLTRKFSTKKTFARINFSPFASPKKSTMPFPVYKSPQNFSSTINNLSKSMTLKPVVDITVKSDEKLISGRLTLVKVANDKIKNKISNIVLSKISNLNLMSEIFYLGKANLCSIQKKSDYRGLNSSMLFKIQQNNSKILKSGLLFDNKESNSSKKTALKNLVPKEKFINLSQTQINGLIEESLSHEEFIEDVLSPRIINLRKLLSKIERIYK